VEAKRLSLDQVKADITMCTSELAMLQGQVQASKNDKSEQDRFYEKMAPFAQDAAEVVEELTRDYAQLESSFYDLVSSFGEDARKFGPIDFFSILDEFIAELKVCKDFLLDILCDKIELLFVLSESLQTKSN